MRNLEGGIAGVVEVKMIRQSCSTTEVQGSARHLSGRENYSSGKEGEPVLTGSAPVRW